MRFEPFLLLQLLLGYTLASVCFLFGISLGAWQLWTSLAVASAAAFLYSRKASAWVLALNALVFVLTLYTYTYVHIDASICHLPMTHFMQDGWNPVRESTIEAVRARFASRGLENVELFPILHIIAGPKFSQILAAQMQSATGLFTALGYPIWIMCIILGVTAFRFAQSVWGMSRWMSAAFGVLVASNYIIAENSFFGLVDYVTYSSIVVSALSVGMWSKTKSPVDLFMFFGGAVMAVSSKFNSLACIALLLLYASVIGRGDRRMRLAFLLFFLSLAVFCIIPYWTSAWVHGSPFYPAHSFRSDVPLMDLTEDFIGNGDANKMGYVARMVYAWISRSLAEWSCALWYSQDTFTPCWRYGFLTSGENPFFCVMFWSGALGSLFINRNRITVLGWMLTAAFLALPVKYIGYSRYVCYVFFIAALFWFNMFAACSGRARRYLFLIPAAFSVYLGGYCVKMFFRQIRSEGICQKNIGRIAESREYGFSEKNSHWAYVLRQRLALEGAAVSSEGKRELEIVWPFVLVGEDLCVRDESVWWSDGDVFPSPVWSSPAKKEGVGR